MTAPIRIKPHHLVDILTALGGGQDRYEPHPYGHALHSVAARILANSDVLLEMDLGADDICAPCVHNISGRCDDVIDTTFRPTAPSSKQAYNLLLDERWCVRLSLKQGDRLSARQFCLRLQDREKDLAGIYRETPEKRVAERDWKLKEGVRRFLGPVETP